MTDRIPTTHPSASIADTERSFVRIGADEAAHLAQTVFGLDAPLSVTRLQTERDDTFRLDFPGQQLLLKVAHPAEDPLVVNLQTCALRHAGAADPDLPLQRQLRSRDGALEPTVTTVAGVDRIARLLTYLPGVPLRECDRSPSQLAACGRMQARLTVALSEFSHPAAGRHLAFDLRHFGELRAVNAALENPLLDRVFAWHDEVLMTRPRTLPVQVLHADFGLDNVLVDPDAPDFVVGVIDWGDVVATWRAADLASGLASVVPTTGDAWASSAAMLSGYEDVIALDSAELEVLRGLAAMRIAQRILMAERLSAVRPENAGYLRRNVPSSYRQLENLYA